MTWCSRRPTPRPIDHVLLAEFLALRTILLNLHFGAGRPARRRRLTPCSG